jgi:ubiquinone/menaquinone biosynthesis C-methylase UbiE
VSARDPDGATLERLAWRRMSTDEIAALKQAQRATWALGDYGEVALRELWEIGPRIVGRVGVASGDDVLDVACGTGNVAIRAAEAGGRVAGLDLTPELFDTAARLAAEAGVEVEWVEGDAEALPFDDDSFDVVLSTFGCMFAPRHELAAGEIARVLRPGGRIGICSWTPEGKLGALLRQQPVPPFASPPHLWGTEEHVAALFADSGIELEFERDVCSEYDYGSLEEALEFFTTTFGPVMRIRRAAEEDGNWDEVRAELIEWLRDDTPAEYLVVVGRKEAA